MGFVMFMGVIFLMSAIAISFSLPFESEWGKRDRAIVILLSGGSLMLSFGILGSLIQYLIGVFQ